MTSQSKNTSLGGAGVARGAVAAALSLSLAVGGVPVQAWAEAADELIARDDQASEDIDPVETENADDLGAEPDAAAASDDGTDDSFDTADGEESGAGSPVAEAAADEGDALLGTSALEVASDSYVFIDTAKDSSGTSARVTGELAVGTTLYANVHDYSSDSAIADDGTFEYQWLAASSASSSASGYQEIEGQTSQELAITDELAAQLAGKYLAVRVVAGDYTIYGPGYRGISSYYVPGPVRVPGQVDIYSATLSPAGDPSSATYVYTVASTIQANAKERGASDYIDPSALTYQWQSSDDGTTYADIVGATSQTLDLENLQGKRVRCVITPAIGSSYTTRATSSIGAEGSVNVTRVSLDQSGKVSPGTTVTATAYAGTTDVSDGEGVTYQWYVATSSYGAGTAIEGEVSATLIVTDDLLGSYVYCVANGGFGDVKSSSVGPVGEAGAVELHHVSVTGATAGSAVHEGDVLTAQAYTSYYNAVSSSDVVHYQWQYADASTTSDALFFDIPGATSATYVVEAETSDGTSLIGKYLRVKATSDGSVVSTQTRSYYGSTSSVSPLGPVSPEGGYDLSNVRISSTGQAGQSGSVLTPTAQYAKKGTYSTVDTDVPDDARVTYVWQVSDADGANARVLTSADGVADDGSLTLSDELVGKVVWVSASALMTPATSERVAVVAAGTYALGFVNLAPSTGTVLTGDTVSATAYASQIGSSSGADVTDRDGVSFQWYVADSADSSEWEALEGATSSSLEVPEEAAGKYLRVVSTSGDSSVQRTFGSVVVSGDSLAGIAIRLTNANWRPSLTYGEDESVNDLLLQELESLGVDTTGISVRVDSVEFSSTNDNATVGISTESEDNGQVTFFSADMDQFSYYYSLGTLRTVRSITWTISREGEEPVSYTPSRTFQVPWDEEAARRQLEEKALELAVGYAAGEGHDSVTQDVTLPYKAGIPAASWTSVSWSSDSAAVAVSGNGWSDYVGSVTRGSADQQATLTATVTPTSSSGMPEGLSVTRTFDLTVLADPERVAAEQAALEGAAESGFGEGSLTYIGDGSVVDTGDVTGDVQLPTPRRLGIDGATYSVSYSTDDASVQVSGYRANVIRPLSGRDAKVVGLTLTVTSRENPEVSYQKTIELAIAPLSADALDDAVSRMDEAKATFASAVLGSQDGSSVTEDLLRPQRAYVDGQGELAWAYDYATGSGCSSISLVELPGYDSMGAADQARLLASSDTSVVTNETLFVTTPEYDTQVTVSARLTDDEFTRYYDLYANDDSVDAETLAKLASLVDQDVSLALTVAGTMGEASQGLARVQVQVIGATDDGATEYWGGVDGLEVNKGSSADAATEEVLSQLGLDYHVDTSWGWYLSTITSPSGTTLGWDEDTGRYWQLFVNGEASQVGASEVELQDGDRIAWFYSSWDQTLDDADDAVVTASTAIVFQGDAGDELWGALASGTFPVGSTAADLTVSRLALLGLDYTAYGDGSGWYLSDITSPDGVSYGWDSATGRYWHLYINGEYATVGAGAHTLEPGDQVVWYYAADDEDWNAPDCPVVTDDPADPGDHDDTTGVSTPTSTTREEWKLDLAQYGYDLRASIYASDPVSVGDYVLLAVGDTLVCLDSTDGSLVSSAGLGSSIDSVSRILYLDEKDLLLVPLSGGSVAGVSVDAQTGELGLVWVSDAIGSDQQSLSTVAVDGGNLIVGTTNANGSRGFLVSVSLETGGVAWARDFSSGFYWGGATVVGDHVLVADNSGTVRSFSSGSDASDCQALDLGTPVYSSVVAVDDSTALVVGRDGTLFKLAVAEDGSVGVEGSVSFGGYSTSTPAVVGGKVYVGGLADGTGALAVIDLDTLAVERVVSTGASGDVKSTPLVNAQDGKTYVYFTANNSSGSAWVYCVEDDSLSVLYQPASSEANYTMASVVLGATGGLYYVTDSGILYRLPSVARPADMAEEPRAGDDSADDGGKATSGTSAASGSKSGTMSLASTVAGGFALVGSAASDSVASAVEAVPLGLLEAGSDSVLTTVTTDADEDEVFVTTGAEYNDIVVRGLPVWPVVGMLAGALALIVAWARRRNDPKED